MTAGKNPFSTKLSLSLVPIGPSLKSLMALYMLDERMIANIKMSPIRSVVRKTSMTFQESSVMSLCLVGTLQLENDVNEVHTTPICLSD